MFYLYVVLLVKLFSLFHKTDLHASQFSIDGSADHSEKVRYLVEVTVKNMRIHKLEFLRLNRARPISGTIRT